MLQLGQNIESKKAHLADAEEQSEKRVLLST